MKKKYRGTGLRVLALWLLLFAISCQKKPVITQDQINAAFAQAEASYKQVVQYNPSETLTYNYRNLIAQAEQAKSKGNLEQALSLAGQANEQAVLTLQLMKDRARQIEEKLKQARAMLELMFPVNQNLVQKFWQLDAKFKSRNLDKLDLEVDKLLKDIEDEGKLSLIEGRSLLVYAPQEYIAQYGNVRIYKEVTPEGKLREVIDTAANGARVKVAKVKLAAPGVTFYYIQTDSGVEGWVAEKYLAGD